MQRNCNILAYRMEKQKASKLGPAVRRFLYIYIYIYMCIHTYTYMSDNVCLLIFGWGVHCDVRPLSPLPLNRIWGHSLEIEKH